MQAIALTIQGNGPVGLALALWLRRAGWPAHALQVLDADGAEVGAPRVIPAALAQRTLALGLGSVHLLQRAITLDKAAAIRSVEISMLGYPARTVIDAAQHGVDQVGAVIRYGDLMGALIDAWNALKPEAMSSSSTSTRVVVHAEGKIPQDEGVREFDQAALTAELGVQHASLAPGRAFERFTDQGPLAMLPLPEPRRYALVWCAHHERVAQRAAGPTASWLEELQQALGPRFGLLELLSPAQVVPLIRRRRHQTLALSRQAADPHHLWIGNAAQSLHPVAGQGLNLGLRDAFELAQTLLRATAVGLPEALQRWHAARRRDATLMIASTDSLAWAFTIGPARPAYNLALGGLNATPLLRNRLARHLMFGRRAA
jgi:2-octaprenyl-6-methoxyphenol hydroxylase